MVCGREGLGRGGGECVGLLSRGHNRSGKCEEGGKMMMELICPVLVALIVRAKGPIQSGLAPGRLDGRNAASIIS